MGRHGALQLGQAGHGGLAARVFGVAQGRQFLTQQGRELFGALAVLGGPLRFGRDARLHQRFAAGQQAGDVGQGLGGLGLAVGADVLCGAGQGVANGLLLCQGLCAGALPLLSQVGGGAFQRCLPGIQACLIGGSPFIVQACDVSQGLLAVGLRVRLYGLGGVGQAVANGLLLGQGLRARSLPLLLQRIGHAVQRGLPAGQALLVGAALQGVLFGLGLAHLRDQGLGAAFEVLAEGLQGLAHALAHAGAVLFVQAQRLRAGLRQCGGGGGELRVHLGQLLLGVVQQALVQGLGLLGQLCHGGLHHGANAVAGQLQALAEAGAQRLVHRLRQTRVGAVHLLLHHVLKAVLAGQQLGVGFFGVGGYLRHQGLQLLQHLRQGLGLLRQRQVTLLLLVRERKALQLGVGQGVELLRGEGAFTPCQAAHQAQHGRGGHARHRGAKGQAQAFDGFGERSPHARNRVGAFEREHRAVEGDHHAQKSAQHAQHDQQAHQVRGEHRAGQGHTLALQALAHRVLQGRRQRDEPVAQLGQVGRNLVQPLAKCGRGGAVLAQLPSTKAINSANQQRHDQHQKVAAGHGRRHPDQGQCAQTQCD